MTGVGGMTIASMEPNTTTLPVHMQFMLLISRYTNSGSATDFAIKEHHSINQKPSIKYLSKGLLLASTPKLIFHSPNTKY